VLKLIAQGSPGVCASMNSRSISCRHQLETCAVHADPSQYRNSNRPYGSGAHVGGVNGNTVGDGSGGGGDTPAARSARGFLRFRIRGTCPIRIPAIIADTRP
jgi:hypothetical protein